jgi:hypothetical protein
MAEKPQVREAKTGGGGVLAVGCLVLLLLGFPVLYIVGLGPAAWLHSHGVAQSALEMIYSPLEWLLPHDGFLADLLEAYVNWWLNRG